MYPTQQQMPNRIRNFDQEPEDDNSRWEIDMRDTLDNLKHAFNSEQKDKNGNWYRPPNVKPKLNETGVNDVISDLEGLLHKGSILANLDINHVKEFVRSLGKSFVKKLVENKETWEVVRGSGRETLYKIYCECIFTTLTRPVADGERKHRSKKHKFTENLSHSLEQPQEITGL
jgi:hypothetical protein